MSTNADKDGQNFSEDVTDGIFDIKDDHSNPPGDVKPDINTYLQIDDKFKEFPVEEGLARTIQSREERLKGQLKTEIEKSEELSTQVRFLDELKDNSELRMAWLNEIDPDYNQDIDGQVTNILTKEFPNFEPVEEDRLNPASSTAKYFRRFNNLYNKFETNESTKTVKEILAISEKNANKSQTKLDESLKQIQKEENWDKSQMDTFLQFAQGFNIFAVKKAFKFKIAGKGTSANLGTKSSSGAFVHPDQMSKAITDRFGKPKSGPEFRKNKDK